MLIRFLGDIGDKTIKLSSSIFDVFKFIFVCLLHMLNPKSYNPAMRMVLVKQIYFTAVEILPLFISMAVLFGSIIIGVVIYIATQLSLQEHIGSIIVKFVIDEFSPFFTAFLIALRSGAAVNTEIAVMNVNRELETLKSFKIDLIDYLFLPRIIGGIFSVMSLSMVFAIIMLNSGFFFTFFYMNMDFYTYKYLIISSIEFRDIAVLLLKGFTFGLVSMLIPIYSGLKTQKSYTAIPISVLNGMVMLFIALFSIEVVSLLIQFL